MTYISTIHYTCGCRRDIRVSSPESAAALRERRCLLCAGKGEQPAEPVRAEPDTGGKFRLILADPPWPFEVWSDAGNGRSAEHHYRTMTLDDIAALPVAEVAARDSALLLWATWPRLGAAMSVIEAWGFGYNTGIPWLKMAARGVPRIGLGYRFRNCSELLLLGIRGNVPAPETGDRLPGAIFCPRGEHSAKPDYQYEIAEGYAGPYLELFHRPRNGMFPPREGWTFLGNEATGRDIAEDLRLLATGELEATR